MTQGVYFLNPCREVPSIFEELRIKRNRTRRCEKQGNLASVKDSVVTYQFHLIIFESFSSKKVDPEASFPKFNSNCGKSHVPMNLWSHICRQFSNPSKYIYQFLLITYNFSVTFTLEWLKVMKIAKRLHGDYVVIHFWLHFAYNNKFNGKRI